MTTRIYVSNKIQKGYKKLVLNALPNKSEMLENQNSWNANYVAIFGRKCWLLTHTLTRYTVIVPDVKVKDTDRFLSILIESIIGQLKIKNIINPDKVYEFIEEVEFYPTNNDRSTIAYNNQRMQDVNYWKFEFDSFEEARAREPKERPFKTITRGATVLQITLAKKDFKLETFG
jgi:hypothetical protein